MTVPDDDPAVVTALHYDEQALADELAVWCGGEVEIDPDDVLPPRVWVPTRKGPQPAQLGDWIVRRAEGDFFPCTAHEFAALHEPLT